MGIDQPKGAKLVAGACILFHLPQFPNKVQEVRPPTENEGKVSQMWRQKDNPDINASLNNPLKNS